MNTIKFILGPGIMYYLLIFKNDIQLNYIRTDRKVFCVSITCPRLWNNLDNSIRNILNLNLFKITFKNVLNSYHYIFNCPFKFIFLTFNLTYENINMINF